jgi:uncharacterized membrane protein
MAKRVRRAVKKEKTEMNDDSKLFAFLAVLLSVLGFIIALLAKRDNKYVMFYAKQSLILFIAGIVAKVLTVLLAITIIGIVLVPIVWVIYAILWIVALVYSISGEEKETPLIGKYARSIKL